MRFPKLHRRLVEVHTPQASHSYSLGAPRSLKAKTPFVLHTHDVVTRTCTNGGLCLSPALHGTDPVLSPTLVAQYPSCPPLYLVVEIFPVDVGIDTVTREYYGTGDNLLKRAGVVERARS